MERNFWRSLTSLETNEHVCAHSHVDECSHRWCGILETEGGRARSFTNILLGSLIYFQASLITVLGGKPRRGSPTQHKRLVTEDLAWPKPILQKPQHSESQNNAGLFVSSNTREVSAIPWKSTSITHHVPSLSSTWTLSQLVIPSDFSDC